MNNETNNTTALSISVDDGMRAVPITNNLGRVLSTTAPALEWIKKIFLMMA